TDVDGDGDLDILTFDVNGGCMEWHRNLSMELYASCDSLVFTRVTANWGNFVESSSSGSISLNDSCNKPPGILPGKLRHSGSSSLAIDIDGDGDKDLILGDIDGSNLSLLINGGSLSSALITNVDTHF